LYGLGTCGCGAVVVGFYGGNGVVGNIVVGHIVG
jgi:hypothetical protein